MKNKIDKCTEIGLFIPRTHLDWSYEQDEHHNYKFVVSQSEHHLFPDDRVMLCVYVRPAYQLGRCYKSMKKTSSFTPTDGWILVRSIQSN